eukprot:2166693-Amphidinium_carterae.1
MNGLSVCLPNPRSKSMKSYVMDLFERYGGGEANIEGVDMYNACYDGQACPLGSCSARCDTSSQEHLARRKNGHAIYLSLIPLEHL